MSHALHEQQVRFETRFCAIDDSAVQLGCTAPGCAYVVATESIVLQRARGADVRFARDRYGFQVVQEGRFGKLLLQAPGDGDAVEAAFRVAREIHRRPGPVQAHPNFLRAIHHTARRGRGPRSTAKLPWGYDNPGNPGVVGADVHARAAWTITKGRPEVRIAVLDEGVDSLHPFLKAAVVQEADFVDERDHARPDGDDAHGTACAGIVASRRDHTPGLARDCSLVGVRIAKSDPSGFWIFDDFDTADAIDWAWDDARADVLSNSWGGGPEVDVITNAFERARTQGRGGLGAVVVVAAGNEQGPLIYPATLPNVLTVGASNEWDRRKTKTSRDGEDWWGSNSGDALDLLAPGVHIRTTDIRGGRGYASGLLANDFNGTSAATPHVAAAAALMLSVSPRLGEARVREIIKATADPLSSGGWNANEGHGRLNAYRAVWQARRG